MALRVLQVQVLDPFWCVLGYLYRTHGSPSVSVCQVTEIQAKLLDGNGVAIEPVKHANLVRLTCLKALTSSAKRAATRTAR